MRERMQKSQVRVNGSRPEARPELARDDLPTANLNRRCKKERLDSILPVLRKVGVVSL